MKFTISREVLLDALNIVAKGLSQKTPMPVLTGILIQTHLDKLILTTSNKEISVQVTITDHKNLVVDTVGSVLIPGKYFHEIIKRINGELIEVAVYEENTVKVISELSNFTLVALEKRNYPDIKFTTVGNKISFDGKDLKKVIEQTAFAASTNENRIFLTGVCFETKDQSLEVRATDSYRLAHRKLALKTTTEHTKVIIPAKALDELAKIITDDGVVSMEFEPNKVLFTHNNTLFMTRLIEGTFPDTSTLLIPNYLCQITLLKSDLIAAVERATLFTNNDSTSLVNISIDQNGDIKVTSTNAEVGQVVDHVIAKNVENPFACQISFSGKNLLEALKSFDSETIYAQITGEVKPFSFRGDQDPDLVQILMPVRAY